MKNIVEINKINKHYKNFDLQDVSFNIPKGTIVGFIGRNGAGKSTTIKSILGITNIDSGNISIFGNDIKTLNPKEKEKLGVVFDECCFPLNLTAKELNTIFKFSYKNWDSKKYFNILSQFELPEKQKIKSFSRGMKMKLQLAVCLAHNTELFILDEATSGLDPIMKNRMLDILRAEVLDNNASVLMSSHILSDIEHLCDYIVFIDHGKILMFEEKDKLIEKYAIIKCSNEELQNIDTNAIVGKKQNVFGNKLLVINSMVNSAISKQKATLEEIMEYVLEEE